MVLLQLGGCYPFLFLLLLLLLFYYFFFCSVMRRGRGTQKNLFGVCDTLCKTPFYPVADKTMWHVPFFMMTLGHLINRWVGRCGLAPQILTLFKTKIIHLTQDQTLLKTFARKDTLFKTFLVIKLIACLRQKSLKTIP